VSLPEVIATIGVGFVVIVVLAWSLRVRRYRAGFRIPARRDDRFSWRGDHVAIGLSLDPGGFDLPPPGLDRGGQTAFLSLAVAATPIGRLFDPFIEIQDGQETHRQYFERGATGQRYLNLSPLWQNRDGDPLARVSLRASSIRWKAEGCLHLFNPPPEKDAAMVVLAPHPDDAEIAAFGMYATHRSWVVTVTAGEKWAAALPVPVSSAESARRSALLRVSDSLTVPQLGEVPPERCVNLAYPDGKLASMYSDANRPFQLACEEGLSRRSLRSGNRSVEFQRGDRECTWNDLVADLRLLLEKTRPDIVLCPHPLLDVHPDHVFTTVALERAMRDIRHPPPLVLLYAVHSRGVPMHPFGPADSLVSLPPWSGDDWVAESIYSHPVAPVVRRTKAFAVESMHGVAKKPAVDERKSGFQVLRMASREISAYVAGTSLDPTSLLRRFSRPNEIFYPVSGKALGALIERALDRKDKEPP
jgi:LmbE family N-acetylglucosaminyl deacetylase